MRVAAQTDTEGKRERWSTSRQPAEHARRAGAATTSSAAGRRSSPNRARKRSRRSTAARSACVVLLDVASLSQKGGSRTNLPGSTDLPETGNGVGGPKPVSKAEDEEVSQAVALQDPHGMAKATLLEAQPWLVHCRLAVTLAIAASPSAAAKSGCQKTTLCMRVVLGSRGKHRAMRPGVRVSGRPKP